MVFYKHVCAHIFLCEHISSSVCGMACLSFYGTDSSYVARWILISSHVYWLWLLHVCDKTCVFHYSLLSGYKICFSVLVRIFYLGEFSSDKLSIKIFLIFLSHTLPRSACVCVGQRTTCWGQFFFHHVGIKNWFCVTRLGSKCLHSLSHLMASLISIFF